ncbi:MAG: ankyrin repeat domain-containing protein [Parachlamydiaceae bacterium]|nr:ankyrin repeat domain-containing protein [Parachlamydiaceae bacterium]
MTSFNEGLPPRIDLFETLTLYNERRQSGEGAAETADNLCIELSKQILNSRLLHYCIPKKELRTLEYRLQEIALSDADLPTRIRAIAQKTIKVGDQEVSLLPMVSPKALTFILSFFDKSSPLKPEIADLTLLANIDVFSWEGEKTTSSDHDTRVVKLLSAEKQKKLDRFYPTEKVTDQQEEEIVRALLDAGASVNAKDNQGRTALMLCGNEKVAKLLVDRKADINAQEPIDKYTALHYAVLKDRFKVLEFLTKVPEIEIEKSSKKGTAISLAITVKKLRAVSILQKHGATHDRHETVGRLVDTAMSLISIDRDSADSEDSVEVESENKNEKAMELKREVAEARKRLQSGVFFLKSTLTSDPPTQSS